MKLVPNAISQTVARQALQGRKASPTLLFGIGVAGMIGSTVLACRATLKVEEVLDKTQKELAKARETEVEEEQLEHFKQETRKNHKGEYQTKIARIYVSGALDVTKLYGPSILLGAAAIGCLTKSHNILNQRNAALTAAYVAVDEAFHRYRRRVVEKYGEEQDRDFRYDHEIVDVIDERGKITQEKRVSPDSVPSMYARFFDEYSNQWSKEPEYNYVFLRCEQSRMNDLLRSRGHVFLNEVYDRLGLTRTTAGSVVGWVISEDGDNFIDFGIFTDRSTKQVRDFVNGREASVLLDFNVDGVIYDKIDGHKERLRWQD